MNAARWATIGLIAGATVVGFATFAGPLILLFGFTLCAIIAGRGILEEQNQIQRRRDAERANDSIVPDSKNENARIYTKNSPEKARIFGINKPKEVRQKRTKVVISNTLLKPKNSSQNMEFGRQI